MEIKEEGLPNPKPITRRTVFSKAAQWGAALLGFTNTACVSKELPRGRIIFDEEENFSRDLNKDALTPEEEKYIKEHRRKAYEKTNQYVSTKVISTCSPVIDPYNNEDFWFNRNNKKQLPDNEYLFITTIRGAQALNLKILAMTDFLGGRPRSFSFSFSVSDLIKNVPVIRDGIKSSANSNTETIYKQVIRILFSLPQEPRLKPALGEKTSAVMYEGNFYDGQEYSISADNNWDRITLSIPLKSSLKTKK